MKFIVFCLLFASLSVYALEVPSLEAPRTVDTEVSTNFFFASKQSEDRLFKLELALHATESNNVEVAFGVDQDANGELAPEETELVLGWDCGAWVVRDETTGKEVRSERGPGDKTFLWNLRLNRERRGKELVARENDQRLFANLDGAFVRNLFSPRWNCLRVTRRGENVANERVTIEVHHEGLSVIVR